LDQGWLGDPKPARITGDLKAGSRVTIYYTMAVELHAQLPGNNFASAVANVICTCSQPAPASNNTAA